ncbi:MAG: hypothetical protein QF535_05075 [Anaerolineales bacterium]|nr:hypothetical protein [Anaerolineales bacterium]
MNRHAKVYNGLYQARIALKHVLTVHMETLLTMNAKNAMMHVVHAWGQQ